MPPDKTHTQRVKWLLSKWEVEAKVAVKKELEKEALEVNGEAGGAVGSEDMDENALEADGEAWSEAAEKFQEEGGEAVVQKEDYETEVTVKMKKSKIEGETQEVLQV